MKLLFKQGLILTEVLFSLKMHNLDKEISYFSKCGMGCINMMHVNINVELHTDIDETRRQLTQNSKCIMLFIHYTGREQNKTTMHLQIENQQVEETDFVPTSFWKPQC